MHCKYVFILIRDYKKIFKLVKLMEIPFCHDSLLDDVLDVLLVVLASFLKTH